MGRTLFAEVMGSGSPDVALDEASLLIAARLQPGLDMIEWLAALDMLAGDCPTPTAAGVARFLFDVEHFTGNRGAYYDWRNSCLDRVIATRSGIPITLSIVMIEVAKRVGVDLVGVGMPAHFLVRSANDEELFFDPFDHGRRLDRAGAQELFATVTSRQVRWDPEFLAPTPNREIVIRILNNLKGVFAQRSDAVRLAIVMGLRAEIDELADVEAAEIVATTSIFN